MSIEFRHLRSFVVLAESLHFGRAAQRLNITQPPLSLTIRQLEDELGSRLFVRDSRSVRLTPFGQAFLPEARRVLAQADVALRKGHALSQGHQGRLHVGFTSSVLFRGLPEILNDFQFRHPGLEIQLRDMAADEQYPLLERCILDGSFCTPGDHLPARLASIALPPDRFMCCVPLGHWAAQRRSVALSLLAGERFIVFGREHAPGGYGRLIDMCSRAGFRPMEAAFVRQWINAVLLVSFGQGIALVPSTLSRAHLERVCFVPLEDEDILASGHFIWNPDWVSPALEELISAVQAFADRPAQSL